MELWISSPNFAYLGCLAVTASFSKEVTFESNSLENDRVRVMDKRTFPNILILGICCFTFEGICTLLPIYDAAEDPDSFAVTYVGVGSKPLTSGATASTHGAIPSTPGAIP